MKILTIILVLIISTLGSPFIGGIEVSASVVLKIRIENPSKTEAQTVPVKVYLPKEVNPKTDIMDLGGLKLNYDAATGTYYVHGEVPLGPGESVNKAVEMKDVWVQSEGELSAKLEEAKEAARQLEGTPYEEEGEALVSEVKKKIEQILKKQEETANNPGERIRAFRQGVQSLASVEQDIFQLGQLKLEASVGETLKKDLSAKKEKGEEASAEEEKEKEKGKDGSAKEAGSETEGAETTIPVGAGADEPPETVAPLGRSISMTTAWQIIFGILIFLGVLSVVAFMSWHRMVGVNAQKEQQGEPLVTEIQGAKGSESSVSGSQTA
jgi:hypothetical protein